MRVRHAVALVATISGVVLAGGTAAQAAPAGTVCSGGPIAAGTYASLTVTGDCIVPSGLVSVSGDVTITAGAALNALTPATVHVGGGITVGSGAALALGCSPAAGCHTTTADIVGRNISALGALAVILHSDRIGGNVAVTGGGGGVTCAPLPFGGPAFTDFEDNVIGGSLSVRALQSCWLGTFRNTIGGSAAFRGNTTADPDGNEVATNTIGGSLTCYRNTPANQVGDSGGAPNVVGGSKRGQCAAL